MSDSNMSSGTSAADIACEFDAKAGHYESNRLSGWYKAHADIVLQQMKAHSGARILDIGCGTGYFLRRVVGNAEGVQGFGLDLSTNMVAQARALSAHLAPTAIRFQQADWTSLSPAIAKQLTAFAPTHAVLLSSLHYFAKPENVFASLRDYLVPGGEIWLAERERQRSLLTKSWDIAHRHLIKDHVAFFDGEQLAGRLAQAGFERITMHHRLQRWFWRGKIFTSTILLSAKMPATAQLATNNMMMTPRSVDALAAVKANDAVIPS